MAVTGQFWYLGQGDPTDARAAYINNDNTNHTVFIDNSPTTTLGTGFPQHIAIDWAAGLYYVISNGGPSGTNAQLLVGQLGSAAAPTTAFTFPGNDGVNTDIVNSIQINPYTHHLYVGICDTNGDSPGFQGVRDFTYNTSTGALTAVATNGGYLFTQTQAQVQSSQASGTDVTDPFDFAIDPDTNFLFFTQLLVSDGFEHNSLWRIDLNNPTAAAFQLVPQAQFPLDNVGGTITPNSGFLYDVEVDRTTDLVYFTTQSLQPSGFPGYDAADNHIYFISETANGSTNATALTITGLPGGNTFYPGNMTFDQLNRVIYVESEESGTISTDDRIYVLQLNAAGTSASLINTITPSPAFTNTAANIGGMAFDALATVGTLTGTSTHAVEQGVAIDLLTAAPTITDVDGDHLASITVQITGGTFVSNETSANDDHLFALDGVVQRTSGLFTGTNITISYTVATETLTLTGYDTFANYQTVLNSIGYFTTGDNPTNYGNNATRTITWQINDGAVGNPSGTVNGASTNVRTTVINIDAVDDAPVNNALANQTTPEDTPEAISFSVSDVDADPANQNITVRLQVTQGTLDINTAVGGGLTAGQVTGDNTNDVLLTGTQNQINATLANATGLRYFNTPDYNGTDTLTVTTNDLGRTGSGGPLTDVDTITITVTPVVDIANDAATFAEDTGSPASILVQANDTFENSGHQITATTNGAHGTVAINDNNTAGNFADDFLVYTQTADFNGTDTFSYVVTSGGVTETASVNVTINAVADIAGDSATTNEDTPVNILVQANDTFENATHAITGTTNGANGTVTVNINGTAGDTTDDFVAYTPNADFNGTDTFTYTVTSNGTTETASVTVTVNAAVDIAGDSATTNEDTPVNVLVQANDTFENPAHAITGTTNGTNGTVTVNNNGTVGDGTDDFVVYTATADFNGTDSFTYTVTSGGVTETATVSVTVNAVVDIADDTATTNEDTPVNILVQGNDNFENAGHQITTANNGANGTVTINNNGTPGNFADDFLVYSPAGNFNGTDSFTYVVTSGGVTETATVSVTVNSVNDAPVYTGTAVGTAFTENGSSVAVATAVSAADLDSADYDTGSLNAQITAGLHTGDTLSIGTTTNISVSGSTVNYDADGGGANPAVAIGTVSGAADNLTVTLNANANDAAVMALTEAFRYSTPSDDPTNVARTVTFTLMDGGGTLNGGDNSTSFAANVPVSDQNDTPQPSAPASYVATPGNPVALTGISFSDFDDQGGVEVATFTVASGTLSAVSGGGVTVGGTATNRTLTGTLTDINAFLTGGNLTFTGTTSTTLGININDQGNTGAGGAQNASTSAQIAVDIPPTANPTSGTGAEDGGRIAITLSGTDPDAGDAVDSFTVASVSGNGTLFDAAVGGTALGAGSTVPATSNSAVVYFQPNGDFNGTTSFTYTAFDGDASGAPATASVTVTAEVDITNDNATTNEDAAVNVLVLANDTFEGTPAITGTTNGTHGTVTVNNNGTPGNTVDDFVVYTPAADFSGTDTFTYTVTSGGVTETASVSVTINAVADIANDNATTNEDTAVNILVLANDTFEATPQITGTTNGANGTVAINDNGTAGNTADDFVVYTPTTPDFNGTDSFTYTVTSAGLTETATVSVTISAVADVVNDSATTNEDAAVNVLVLGNDNFEGTPAITGTTNGAHGTVAVNDNGTAGNTADDFVVYTPTTDFNGTDTFTYSVTSGGVTETGTATVTVNAVADIANDNATTNEDTPVNILVQGNDTFEDAGHQITGTTNGTHGTVTINDNGTAGNFADDFVVYTPAGDFNGTDTFTYTVTSGGATETATVSVTVNAVADIANDSASTNEDTPVNVLVLANDMFEGSPAITGTTNGAHGSVAVNDNGTAGNTADDFVVYTPTTADFNGTDSFTYTVTSGGVTETATVSVTLTAVADIVNDTATTNEDTPVNVLVLGNDNFEGTPAITGTTNGAHGSVAVNDNGTAGNTADDFVVYTPTTADFNGTDSFTYTATSGGVTETGTVSVTISPVTDIADNSATTNEDTAVNVLVLGNDNFEGTPAITATTNGAHGTVTVNNNGTPGNTADDFVVYTPAGDFNGTDAFTYTVTSGGVTETATVSVTVNAVVNIADDSATTNEDAAVNVLVLGNDNFEGTPAISGTTNGAQGTVTINNNGTPGNTADDFVVFTPAADFVGTDAFTYTVTSGGATETATVSVTITAVADIVNDNVTVVQDSGANNLNLLANDTFENATRAITAVGAAAHGTTSINNNGTPGNTADDFVVYSPTAGYIGPDTFTYTVTSAGTTETATVSVTVEMPVSTTPTPGDDSLVGTDGPDTILGFGGDDVIDGLGGADILFGNPDDDTVFGRTGNDTVWGGLGNDSIDGAQDDDLLFGGEGQDTIDGGDGANTIVGGLRFLRRHQFDQRRHRRRPDLGQRRGRHDHRRRRRQHGDRRLRQGQPHDRLGQRHHLRQPGQRHDQRRRRSQPDLRRLRRRLDPRR